MHVTGRGAGSCLGHFPACFLGQRTELQEIEDQAM